MMEQFESICEAVNVTLRQTKTIRYPRQIKLSEEFLESLRHEYSTHVEIIDESNRPIRDLPIKFLKAMKFELSELNKEKS